MTQNHQTNNNEIEFLENIEQNMPLNKKQNFPKIISNGLVEINDPISFSLRDPTSIIIFFISLLIFTFARYEILLI